MDASDGNREPPASSVEWSATKERDRVPATVGRRPLQFPPPVHRRSINAATRGPAVAPSELQQLTLRGPLPTRSRNTLPSPRTIGARRGMTVSCGRPSPRPTSRSRHRSPSPPGWNIIAALTSLLPGILGRRQRSTSPPAGMPMSHQRRRFTFTEDTRSKGAWVPREEIPAGQDHRPAHSTMCLPFPRL